MRAFMWTEIWGDQRKMCTTDYREGVTISVRLMSQGGFSLRPGQTLATFQRNILQHCWAQHVAYVWPPCCDVLRCVATCWMMLDQIWKRSNFSCNILDVAWCCTRLATFTQHCCARACALGPLAIATRQRHDGFLSATMANNTAQIQQPKNKCPRKWTEGETTSLIDLLEERPCLWNIFEKSYHSRETREQGFEELQSTLNISMVDIKAKIVSLRAQLGREIAKTREQGFEELRHVAMNVACVWPARSITVATSSNNVARCCVEMLRAFGQAFILSGSKTNSQVEEAFPLVLYSLL